MSPGATVFAATRRQAKHKRKRLTQHLVKHVCICTYLYISIYICLYIYIVKYAVVFDNGVFFLFHFFGNAPRQLPGMRSKMGRAEVRCQKTPIFIVFCWVHQRISYHNGCEKYPASSWGTMLKIRLSKTNFWSFNFGTAFWLRVGVKVALYRGVQNGKNCRENGVLTFPILKWTHDAQNRGLEKMDKICFFGRAHPHLCVFVGRAWIRKKNGLSKSPKLA